VDASRRPPIGLIGRRRGGPGSHGTTGAVNGIGATVSTPTIEKIAKLIQPSPWSFLSPVDKTLKCLVEIGR
jgi:hypothetical protein